MATTEHTGLMTYIDENGNPHILYPVTNINAVDGLQEALDGKVDKSSVVNNFTTTEEGFVADARALKVLNDSKLSMERLWENASPASHFAEQDINNAGSYDAVLGLFFVSNGTRRMVSALATIGETMRTHSIDGANSNIAYLREWTLNQNSITVSGGKKIQGTTVQDNNGYIIPWRFYGIKGVSA